MSEKTVFISWSGNASKNAAKAFRKHLKSIVPDVEVFMSEEDIAKGAKGLAEIERKLSQSAYGVILVTKENREAPWINYEAGAISKGLGANRVVPILCDLTIGDLGTAPLSNFQAVELDSEKMFKLFDSIRTATKSVIDKEQLKTFFDVFYIKLSEEIAVAVERTRPTGIVKTETQVAIDNLARQLQALRFIVQTPERLLPIEYLAPLFAGLSSDETLSAALNKQLDGANFEKEKLDGRIDELVYVMNDCENYATEAKSKLDEIIEEFKESDDFPLKLKKEVEQLEEALSLIDQIESDLMFAV